MMCESARILADAYFDEELDAGLSSQMRKHLAGCESCAGLQAQHLALRTGMREQAPYYHAPAQLPDRIRGSLRQAAAEGTRPWRWLAVAASVMLAASLAWNFALWRSRAVPPDLAADIFSSHVRSLIGSHLLDVSSSDQHNVKPWFNGKLDFSPVVKDLAGQGFPLIGGRVDYVGDRPVAVLVYQRRQHVVNLFTWPSSASGGGSESTRNGYQMVHWNSGGMTWWAVSDLGSTELRRFAGLYRE